MKLFGSKEFCRLLIFLGFSPSKQEGTSHIKYKVPSNIKIPQGIRPFIIVQLGKKQYFKNTCSRYVSQVKRFGYKKDEIVKHIK